jgi:anti-anti-sigma factor
MITTRRFANALVVQVAGRLDHDTSVAFGAELQKAIEASEPGVSIVIDLSPLDYASSSGLNSLMQASRRAKERQRGLSIAAPQALVAEMFAISRVNLMLQVFSSVREALAVVSGEAAAAYDAAQPSTLR